ncbi:unnamed protein product (macronuclear) [Paramecium tetraurelia]|uniref:EF-hand domain-containing protein n=1 Tax=Paramecium tetraurelia TaxID=5888 RepID=A0DVI1_PARTE|nr:uncharacterized protein GSPATT00020701001 [Paramecium tetraurelia]CAK87048.1 unnamed protein product [Paramecium tetraurelia]|eukprot:XP_001454445.1 hypothetical protein (macronuclear) [Paramecium tetraurelia strain d4-2]
MQSSQHFRFHFENNPLIHFLHKLINKCLIQFFQWIRFGKSPQPIQKNLKKPDNLEILTLLDNCTLIFKDDRIALRNMVKEGNQDVIAILNHYKKGNNLKDLSTDLRKYLRRKGDKENDKVLTCQSPTSNRMQKVQQLQLQPLQNSQKKSCPDLWKPVEQQSPKTINLGKINQFVNDVQFSEITLNKPISKLMSLNNMHFINQPIINQTIPKQFNRAVNYKTSSQHQLQDQEIDINQDDDIQSESSNESILNQITQPPPQIQDITPKNEVKPSQLFQSGHSTYIQINTAQSYLQPLLSIQDKTTNPHKSQETENKIIVNDSQKYYSFYNYQDYQKAAQPQYKHLFTHWPSLLHKLDQPEYVSSCRVVPYINATPEQIFTVLFPNSSRVKISYYAFENQLKHNLLQIDRDSLFKELDKDQDDWINYSETGVILEGLCLQVEQPKNCVKVIFETLKSTSTTPNTLSLSDLEQFEQKTDFQFARQLMQEVDGNQKGYLTYWDLYMHRDIFLMERLCQIVSSITGATHTHY